MSLVGVDMGMAVDTVMGMVRYDGYVHYVVKGEKDACNGDLMGSEQVGMVMSVLEYED